MEHLIKELKTIIAKYETRLILDSNKPRVIDFFELDSDVIETICGSLDHLALGILKQGRVAICGENLVVGLNNDSQFFKDKLLCESSSILNEISTAFNTKITTILFRKK